jgi:hypothetical protein
MPAQGTEGDARGEGTCSPEKHATKTDTGLGEVGTEVKVTEGSE